MEEHWEDNTRSERLGYAYKQKTVNIGSIIKLTNEAILVGSLESGGVSL